MRCVDALLGFDVTTRGGERARDEISIIVGRDVYVRKPQQRPGKLCLIGIRIAQNVCGTYFLFLAVRNNVDEIMNSFVLQRLENVGTVKYLVQRH